MSTTDRYDRFLSYVNCHVAPAHGSKPTRRRLAITISREAGAGGRTVADQLAQQLGDDEGRNAVPWTVLDRDIVEKALEDHQLPARLAQSIHEDRVNELEDMMQEMLGARPSSWKLVTQISETILKLAELGNVILVGRGANLVTARLEHVFHVRLVAPLERRIEWVAAQMNLSPKAARAFTLDADRGRARYVKKYFGADVGNPLLYHLLVNTDRIDPEAAATVIASAARAFARRG